MKKPKARGFKRAFWGLKAGNGVFCRIVAFLSVIFFQTVVFALAEARSIKTEGIQVRGYRVTFRYAQVKPSVGRTSVCHACACTGAEGFPIGGIGAFATAPVGMNAAARVGA